MSRAAVQAIGVAVLLLTAIVVGARMWAPSFFPLLGLGMVFAGYAAHRWPRATLVVACLATLVDPVLVRVALPSEIGLGPIGASEPILAAAGLVIVANAIRLRTFLEALRDPVLTLSILFVLAAAASAILNAAPAHVAVLGIVMTVDAIAIYFVARMARFDDRSASVAICVLVALAVLAALFGVMQVLLHPNLLGFATFSGRFGEGGRITSFLGNPNLVAMIVGIALPFPVLAARRASSPRMRWLALVAAYLLVLALLLTFSRGGWLAVVVGIVIGAMVFDRRVLLTFLLLAVVAGATTYVMPRYLLLSPEEYARYFPGADVPSLIDSTVDRIDRVARQQDLRLRFVREGLPIVRDHPWLGVGPGRYGGAAAAIIESPVYAEYDTGLYGFRTVHNFWLHLFGEVGVIGGAIFVTLIAGLWLRLARSARSVRDGPDERSARFLVLAGAATMLLIVSLHSATEMAFEGNIPAMLVWLVVGIATLLTPRQGLLGARRD